MMAKQSKFPEAKMAEIIKGHAMEGTLADWFEFAKRDDCLDRMVPSDLRTIINAARRPENEDRVIETARELAQTKTDTFKARNGRNVGVQGDDGEKCFIVHSDQMFGLETALAEYDKRRAELKQNASANPRT